MNRRTFLAAALTAPLAGQSILPSLHASTTGPLPGWRHFSITTDFLLPDTPGPIQLWAPLVQTAGSYQFSSTTLWDCGAAQTELVYDARYGAPILRTLWKENDPGARILEITQYIAARDRERKSDSPEATLRESPLEPLTEAERKFWMAPTKSKPLDGVVLATAAEITAGKRTPRERLRAIYDWVIDHTHRDPDVPGCGRGDIRTMLEKNQLGGKCADINGLLVGLARAAGFPARDVYGIRVAPSKFFPCLGCSGDARERGNSSKAQHCRAEVFLDGEGWFPLDPADVCKVVLESKLALDSPQIREFRDQQFGNWEMNWVGYNSATDIELPGSDGSHRPGFPFLMYPYAFTSEGDCPSTDPEKFYYRITSKEFTV